MNLFISGLLINNCIAINDPKEKPDTQHCELSKFSLSNQSSAAAALDWLERENFDNSQCWISGFSFGSLIAMQLLMRRPEINRFIAISPQPNVYDFSFLSPCPTSGLMVYGKKDELVPNEYIKDLDKRPTSSLLYKNFSIRPKGSSFVLIDLVYSTNVPIGFKIYLLRNKENKIIITAIMSTVRKIKFFLSSTATSISFAISETTI